MTLRLLGSSIFMFCLILLFMNSFIMAFIANFYRTSFAIEVYVEESKSGKGKGKFKFKWKRDRSGKSNRT